MHFSLNIGAYMSNFLKRIFLGQKKTSGPRSVGSSAPSRDKQIWESGDETRPQPKFAQLIASSAIDMGLQRENNEDALLSFTGALGGEASTQPFGLFAVADGMGGHNRGEAASEAALRALGNHVISKLYYSLLGPDPQPTQESLHEILKEGVNMAHREVKKVAPGGGCTLTAALVVGAQLIIAHLGDSRAYIIHRDGSVQVLTKDHSLVKRLQEMGKLTEEEAANHPQKSVIYRALGQGDMQADIFTSTLPTSAFLLICSDGLWGTVSEEKIRQTVNSASSLYLACQNLVKAANDAGGPDNISIVLVRLIN